MNDLFKKYDVPAPRYTSYPTVPFWNDPPTSVQWLESLRRALTPCTETSLTASSMQSVTNYNQDKLASGQIVTKARPTIRLSSISPNILLSYD